MTIIEDLVALDCFICKKVLFKLPVDIEREVQVEWCKSYSALMVIMVHLVLFLIVSRALRIVEPDEFSFRFVAFLGWVYLYSQFNLIDSFGTGLVHLYLLGALPVLRKDRFFACWSTFLHYIAFIGCIIRLMNDPFWFMSRWCTPASCTLSSSLRNDL